MAERNDREMKKKISIVTACYNAEKTLPRCVESLQAQTIGWDAIELIFVDDASADGTAEYLQSLQEKHPEHIIVIRNEENRKQGICRNLGMKYASGEYIGFVDADDWIHPEMYEDLYQAAQEYRCDMVGCRLVRVEERGGEDSAVNTADIQNVAHAPCSARGRLAPRQEDTVIAIEAEKQRRELLAQGMGAFDTVHVVTKLYRREFIEEYGLHFGEHYAFEDLYFSDLAAFYVNRFAIIPAEYYHYLIHSGSVMTSMDLQKWLAQRSVMLLWLETCTQRGLLEKYRQEAELIFIRDYYISNLHFLLTRNAIGREEAEAAERCRRVACEKFPRAADNIYIQAGGYIHEFQEPLVAHIQVPFRRGELMKLQEAYHRACLSMLKNEHAHFWHGKKEG